MSTRQRVCGFTQRTARRTLLDRSRRQVPLGSRLWPVKNVGQDRRDGECGQDAYGNLARTPPLLGLSIVFLFHDSPVKRGLLGPMDANQAGCVAETTMTVLVPEAPVATVTGVVPAVVGLGVNLENIVSLQVRMGGGNDSRMTALQDDECVSMAPAMTGSLQVPKEKYGLVTVN